MRLLAVLALLVLVAVGCGGGDDSSVEASGDRSDVPAGDEAPSGDDLAEEVAELCADWFAEVLDTEGSLREIAEEVSETSEDLADELEELEVEEGLVEAVGDYGDHLADLAAELQASEEQYGDSAEVTGLSPDEQDAVVAAREDLADAFEEVDADCGFDEADSDLAPFEGDSEDEPTGDTVASEDPTSTVPVQDAQLPWEFIEEYGTNADFDLLADQCFAANFEACDQLYRETPVSDTVYSYEGYGASCGGRRSEELAGTCAAGL
jgi:hypothetical protein